MLHLELFPSGEVIDSTPISTEFEESFLILPKEYSYRFTIECPQDLSYHSPPFVATGSTYSETPIDLGAIDLEEVSD